MFLPVLLSTALENMGTICERSGRVAEHKFLGRNDQIAIRRSDSRVGHDRKRFDVGSDLLCGLSRLFIGLRKNDRDRLADKMHLAVSQQWLVRHDPADLIFADQVAGKDHANDAFAFFGLARIDALQLAMGDRRIKNACVQRPANDGNVVQINALAANV